MQRFSDKVVLVTGAAGAIGSAAVRRFHAEGARVACVDCDAVGVKALASELGPRAMAIPVDVRDPEAVAAMVAEVVKTFGNINVLFNNAGISGRVAPFHELPLADWHEIVDINLHGVFHVLQSVLRSMIDGGIAGSVVNMSSSMAGFDVLAGGAGYAATKFGILGITRSAALDCARWGIRINAICPGVIETRLGVPSEGSEDFEAGSTRFANRIPLRRIGQPEDVAATVAFLASQDACHITGAHWLIDGGQTLQSWANAPDADAFPKI